MAKNLANLVEKSIKSKRAKEAAEEALKERIRQFEESEDIQALKTAVLEAEDQFDKDRFALIEEMQVQKVNEFDGDVGRASISRKKQLVWGDTEKMISYIEEHGTPEMKENIKVSKTFAKSTTLKKTIQELLEIDKPKELIDTGTRLEDVTTVTITDRSNA